MRIKGAYKGYQNFNQAWQEIQNIPFNPANNLRKFCQEYASAVLEIHEKYFQEEPEQVFEGNARQLVEAKCEQQWASYLSQFAYKLSAVSTTTVLASHAFDCYVELLHNNIPVARAFINTADKSSLVDAFKGTRVYETTIEKIRKQRPYTDLDDLVSKLRFTQKVKTKLEDKLKEGKIDF